MLRKERLLLDGRLAMGAPHPGEHGRGVSGEAERRSYDSMQVGEGG